MRTVELEPDRYGRTGCGIGLYNVEIAFMEDMHHYCIDAPRFVPKGSTSLHWLDVGTKWYASTTVEREY